MGDDSVSLEQSPVPEVTLSKNNNDNLYLTPDDESNTRRSKRSSSIDSEFDVTTSRSKYQNQKDKDLTESHERIKRLAQEYLLSIESSSSLLLSSLENKNNVGPAKSSSQSPDLVASDAVSGENVDGDKQVDEAAKHKGPGGYTDGVNRRDESGSDQEHDNAADRGKKSELAELKGNRNMVAEAAETGSRRDDSSFEKKGQKKKKKSKKSGAGKSKRDDVAGTELAIWVPDKEYEYYNDPNYGNCPDDDFTVSTGMNSLLAMAKRLDDASIISDPSLIAGPSEDFLALPHSADAPENKQNKKHIRGQEAEAMRLASKLSSFNAERQKRVQNQTRKNRPKEPDAFVHASSVKPRFFQRLRPNGRMKQPPEERVSMRKSMASYPPTIPDDSEEDDSSDSDSASNSASGSAPDSGAASDSDSVSDSDSASDSGSSSDSDSSSDPSVSSTRPRISSASISQDSLASSQPSVASHDQEGAWVHESSGEEESYCSESSHGNHSEDVDDVESTSSQDSEGGLSQAPLVLGMNVRNTHGGATDSSECSASQMPLVSGTRVRNTHAEGMGTKRDSGKKGRDETDASECGVSQAPLVSGKKVRNTRGSGTSGKPASRGRSKGKKSVDPEPENNEQRGGSPPDAAGTKTKSRDPKRSQSKEPNISSSENVSTPTYRKGRSFDHNSSEPRHSRSRERNESGYDDDDLIVIPRRGKSFDHHGTERTHSRSRERNDSGFGDDDLIVIPRKGRSFDVHGTEPRHSRSIERSGSGFDDDLIVIPRRGVSVDHHSSEPRHSRSTERNASGFDDDDLIIIPRRGVSVDHHSSEPRHSRSTERNGSDFGDDDLIVIPRRGVSVDHHSSEPRHSRSVERGGGMDNISNVALRRGVSVDHHSSEPRHSRSVERKSGTDNKSNASAKKGKSSDRNSGEPRHSRSVERRRGTDSGLNATPRRGGSVDHKSKEPRHSRSVERGGGAGSVSNAVQRKGRSSDPRGSEARHSRSVERGGGGDKRRGKSSDPYNGDQKDSPWKERSYSNCDYDPGIAFVNGKSIDLRDAESNVSQWNERSKSNHDEAPVAKEILQQNFSRMQGVGFSVKAEKKPKRKKSKRKKSSKTKKAEAAQEAGNESQPLSAQSGVKKNTPSQNNSPPRAPKCRQPGDTPNSSAPANKKASTDTENDSDSVYDSDCNTEFFYESDGSFDEDMLPAVGTSVSRAVDELNNQRAVTKVKNWSNNIRSKIFVNNGP